MKIQTIAIIAIITTCLTGAAARAQELGEVVRLDSAVDAIIPADAKVEKIGDGFGFLEGPIWIHSRNEGYLLFSDIPANVIRKWDSKSGFSVFLEKSGF